MYSPAVAPRVRKETRKGDKRQRPSLTNLEHELSLNVNLGIVLARTNKKEAKRERERER